MFDPFGDYELNGYLRNRGGLKDLEALKRVEHSAFLDHLEAALTKIKQLEYISYQDVLDTHKELFLDVYPWAGQDRQTTASNLSISKGSTVFAHPDDARAAVEYGLSLGQDQDSMVQKPGEVMGYLAYGHPFLDGNGRALMVVHTVLCERAGISIDWAATVKNDYLTALSREIQNPEKGQLDDYLRPHVSSIVGADRAHEHIAGISGLDGDRRLLNQRQPPDGIDRGDVPAQTRGILTQPGGDEPSGRAAVDRFTRELQGEKFTREQKGDRLTRDLDDLNQDQALAQRNGPRPGLRR